MKKFHYIGLIGVLTLGFYLTPITTTPHTPKSVQAGYIQHIQKLNQEITNMKTTTTPAAIIASGSGLKVNYVVKHINDKRYTKTKVNFRKTPKIKKKNLIQTLPAGKKVKRIGLTKNGWAQVKYKNKIGFIKNKYLSKKKPKIYSFKNVSNLRGHRKKKADYIATVVSKNYAKYKVLPSICIAQAIVESGLGEKCNPNNYWGISSNGYAGYSSIDAGIHKYLSVINNGYYKRAVGETNYRTAAYAIQNGGYCCPKAGYANKIISTIEIYDLNEYDRFY